MIVWLDVFVDVPTARAEAFRQFWVGVTGWHESGPRGDRGQFRSLLPGNEGGRAYLRIQELDREPRIHLDLVSTDLPADRARVMGFGAVPVASLAGVEILTSPAGQVFCLVQDDEPRPVVQRDERARVWPDGHRSRFTHVCLDVPPADWDAELEFWSATTGWQRSAGSRPEYTWLESAADLPLRLLLQRLDRPGDVAGAHLDLGTTDVGAEVGRLLALGAVDIGPGPTWHLLRDPVVGLTFCVTSVEP